MAEHTCPQCGHTTEIRIVVDLGGDQVGDQLLQILRREIRRRGGGTAGVLASN